MKSEELRCFHCGKTYYKKDLERYCSNCFGCTGCERYVCPNCEGEIVVTPLKRLGK